MLHVVHYSTQNKISMSMSMTKIKIFDLENALDIY